MPVFVWYHTCSTRPLIVESIQSFSISTHLFLRFGALKAYVLAKGLALTLKVLDGGSENAVDTLMDNKVLTASVLAGLYIVYG